MAVPISPEVLTRMAEIRLVSLDVDGVLTDGVIELPEQGGETKRFHVADGLGIQLLLNSGVEVVWISGRSSRCVAQRAEELGVSQVYQGVRDKRDRLVAILAELRVSPEQTAHMGDDLNDLPAFDLVGLKLAPANGCSTVLERADWVSASKGGHGAVRDMAETLLEAQGKLSVAVQSYLENPRVIT